MSEFGRHKSTRWTKAQVPSYGDEWGDEYDYGYSDTDQEHQEHGNVLDHEDQKDLKDHEYTDEPISKKIGSRTEELSPLEENNVEENERLGSVRSLELRDNGRGASTDSNLVLSIDNFKNRLDESSSEDEDEDEEEDHELSEKQLPEDKSTSEKSTSKPSSIKQELSAISVEKAENSFVPPTPTFNDSFHAETPISDRSYISDADSIQMEPSDLNVAERFQEQNESRPLNAGASSIIEQVSDKESTEEPEERAESERVESERAESERVERERVESERVESERAEPEEPEPLVLSIDKRDFNYSSDDVDDGDVSNIYDGKPDDDWGYNSQHSSNEENHEHKDDHEEYNHEEPYEYDYNYSSDEEPPKQPTDALDSLIHDLQRASYHDKEDNYSEKYQTPEGEISEENHQNRNIMDKDKESEADSSFGLHLDSFDVSMPDFYADSPTTPIAPLSSSEEREGHDNYLKESGYRRSIRKPPPNRSNLVSVDYSNIADAVSGYMEKEKMNKIGEEKSEEEVEEEVEEEENASKDMGENNDNMGENVGKPDFDTSSDVEEPRKFGHELQPVNSLGSLSTGKFSFETTKSSSQRGDNQSIVEPIEYDNSRRVSTMSTSTFNMGSWTPNTNKYRDQFIDDNDNESLFNPQASESNNYSRFTKQKSSLSSEVKSDTSSISVPETIDAALPSIHENDDNEEDEDHYDDAYSFVNSHAGSSAFQTAVPGGGSSESVLHTKSYPQALFKEEKLTPYSSHNVETQRYSSLIPVSEESKDTSKDVSKDTPKDTSKEIVNDKEENRNVSTSSEVPTLSSLANKKYVSKAYPVFDWKTIMATSQPIDRIRLLKEALEKESQYDTGLENWLVETLKSSEESSNMHIGKIASEAYSNATHNDIRRHASLRSKVSIVKDKVETSGLHASSFGKRFLSRGKKFMKGGE